MRYLPLSRRARSLRDFCIFSHEEIKYTFGRRQRGTYLLLLSPRLDETDTGMTCPMELFWNSGDWARLVTPTESKQPSEDGLGWVFIHVGSKHRGSYSPATPSPVAGSRPRVPAAALKELGWVSGQKGVPPLRVQGSVWTRMARRGSWMLVFFPFLFFCVTGSDSVA